MDKSKKLVILIILIIVAIFVWMPKGRRTQPPLKKGARPLLKGARPLLKPGSRKRSEFADWGRNPFLWPKEGESALSGLKLSGIVWDEQTPYAIINNAVLHTGDKINGKTIKRIEHDKVILTDGLNDFRLELE